MSKLLWKPSEKRIKDANISHYMDFLKQKHGLSFKFYGELYDWSLNNIPEFWSSVWDFAEIRASKKYDTVVEDLSVFPGTKWFPGSRLNFAENLLRYRDDREIPRPQGGASLKQF